MIRKIILKGWRASAAMLALGSFFLVACAPVSNPALERARLAYEHVRRDPGVAGRAGVALDKTRVSPRSRGRSPGARSEDSARSNSRTSRACMGG